MRNYTVTLVWFTYGKRLRRFTRTIKFKADPLLAYDRAKSLCHPGEAISTFWYD